MDAFVMDGRGILIFRTDQKETAQEVIRRSGLRALAASDLPLQA